jgi:hypothetical protein
VEPLGGSENAIKTLPGALLPRVRGEKASGWQRRPGQNFGEKALLRQLAA